MDLTEFLATIYLGDRACKGICIDGWQKRLEIIIDEISRVRSSSGEWEYYTDEDILDGRLVFSGVSEMRFDPPGPLPNDSIELEQVEELTGRNGTSGIYHVRFLIGSVDAVGNSHAVHLDIVATGIHLEDPNHPGIEIRD